MVNGPKIFAKTKADEYFKSLPHQPGAKKALERRLLRKRNRSDREYLRLAKKRGMSLNTARAYLRVRNFTANYTPPVVITEHNGQGDHFFTLAVSAADVSKKHLTITRKARGVYQQLHSDMHFDASRHDTKDSGKYYLDHVLGDLEHEPGKKIKFNEDLNKTVIGIDPGAGFGVAVRGYMQDGKLTEITSFDLVSVDNEKRIVDGQG